MQNLDVQVISKALEWLGRETPVWLATVVSTYGSAPRKPGSMFACTGSGLFVGSLSGGCIEEDFIERVVNEGLIRENQTIRYGEGGLAPTLALPCGGVLDVLLEYLQPNAANLAYLNSIWQALTGHAAIRRLVEQGGASWIEDQITANSAVIKVSEKLVSILVGATPRLVLAGYSPVAAFCGQFAHSIGYEVVICEPREEQIALAADQLPMAVHVPLLPARYISPQTCHSRTAVVALTHDPRMDDLTVMEAITTEAFYIGAMGSVRTSAKRRDRLARLGDFSEAMLDRLHAPIGLNLGSKTPPEIALAIMADVVRTLNGIETSQL